MLLAIRRFTWKVLLVLSMACSGGAFGQAVTSVNIISQSNQPQTNVPVTFGQVFKKGDVPSGSDIGATLNGVPLDIQVDKKATNNDGSLRHAVISAIIPTLNGNESQELVLTDSGSQPATPAPVLLNNLLTTTNFDAEVTINIGGVLYSLSARELLQAGQVKQWLEGDVVSEWIVGGPLHTSGAINHPQLAAYFHVRAYSGLNNVRVDVVVENNWTMVSGPGNFVYDASISIGGVEKYSLTGLEHYHHARWHKVFWWKEVPQVYVKHDSDYLQATGAVPEYQNVTPSEGTLDGMLSSVTPMSLGNMLNYMATSGENQMIGPLPQWASLYIVSTDSRAYISTLLNGDAGGTYSSHYRNESTGYPAIIDDDCCRNAQIGNTGFPSVTGANPNRWDIAHQPSIAFVPYLVTGDYYYLEELQFWASANMLATSPNTRKTQIGLQKRGQAWSLRTLGQAAYITPDDHPLKDFFVGRIAYYMAAYDQEYTNNPDANKLGVIWDFADHKASNLLSNAYFTVWMDDYLTWSVGYLVELGFDEAIPFRNWKTRFPAERMGGTDYCWQVATPSQMQMGVYDVWYGSFKELYDNNFPQELTSLECGTQAFADYIAGYYSQEGGTFLINEMTKYGNEPDGHPSKLRPALAIAVDAHTDKADIGWDRLMLRADAPDYSNNPKYAIMPRTLVDSGRPYLMFNTLEKSLSNDGYITLDWESSNADNCIASGSWSGFKSMIGEEVVGPVTNDAVFQLSCSNNSGETIRTVALNQVSNTAGQTSTSGSGSAGSTSGGGGALSPWAANILFLMLLLLIRRDWLHPRQV